VIKRSRAKSPAGPFRTTTLFLDALNRSGDRHRDPTVAILDPLDHQSDRPS
jgi:hypothetical protein